MSTKVQLCWIEVPVWKSYRAPKWIFPGKRIYHKSKKKLLDNFPLRTIKGHTCLTCAEIRIWLYCSLTALIFRSYLYEQKIHTSELVTYHSVSCEKAVISELSLRRSLVFCCFSYSRTSSLEDGLQRPVLETPPPALEHQCTSHQTSLLLADEFQHNEPAHQQVWRSCGLWTDGKGLSQPFQVRNTAKLLGNVVLLLREKKI